MISFKLPSTFAVSSFSPYADNPLFPGHLPSVIIDDGTYKIWFSQSNGIGYATSPDGLHWTQYS
jgi:hypothetical protein